MYVSYFPENIMNFSLSAMVLPFITEYLLYAGIMFKVEGWRGEAHRLHAELQAERPTHEMI